MKTHSLIVFALVVARAFAADPAPKPEIKLAPPTPGWRYEEIRRVAAPEARQGVVADREHLYAIDDRAVAKYRKSGGERLAIWEGDKDGPIIHLNAGVVVEGKLYCAHSNFPGVPMLSSVEIFETATLKHVGSHSFGRTDGSLTWVTRRDDKWIACFVHYGRRGGEPGRGPEWTQLIEFDDQWRRTGGWGFPPEFIAHVGVRGYSVSGGARGPGGYIYATGHDHPELYVLEIPTGGSVLKWIATVPITADGQAFAWDPVERNVLYTVGRKTKEVIVGRVTLP